MKNKSKWVWRGLALAIVLAALAYAFRPQPVPVDMAVAQHGELVVTVADDGETRVRDVYLVSAPLPGQVLRFEGDVGDPVVAAETVLANILPTQPTFLDVRTRSELEAAVQAAQAAKTLAEAELARAQAQVEYAEAEYRRAERLFERGNVSEAALDRARMELRTEEAAMLTSRAALSMREFELETARASLILPSVEVRDAEPQAGCCYAVRAPVDGRILRIFHESEGVIEAGAPLVEIGDPRDMEIVVDLLSTDAVRVVEGAEAFIEGWGGGERLIGRVRRVEPYGFTKTSALGIDEQRVNVIVDFTGPADRWQALGHGYRVEVAIVVWRGEDVLTVPVGTLFRDGDDWAVFVVEDGRAALRRIQIGHMNGTMAEVLDGLAEGETLIQHPSDRIANEVLVAARPNGGG